MTSAREMVLKELVATEASYNKVRGLDMAQRKTYDMHVVRS